MRAKAAHAFFGAVVPVLFFATPLRSLQISLLRPFAADQQIVCSLIDGVLLMIAISGTLAPLIACRRARRTWYVVTDRRLLRFRGEVPHAVMSLEDVETMTLRVLEDGTGDVLFSSRPAYYEDIVPRPLRGFFGVSEAERVHRTINEAREERMRDREHVVHDYLELLLQGKRPEDISFR